MNFCTSDIINESCDYLINLDLCSTCEIALSQNNEQIVMCNNVVMTCVYGELIGGSTALPYFDWYNTISTSNVLIVVDESDKNEQNYFTVAPSTDYIVDQVYSTDDMWMKSMTIVNPELYAINYENSYSASQTIYTFYGLSSESSDSSRKLTSISSELSYCEPFSTYDCDILEKIGICSNDCPNINCSNNVITTCNNIVVPSGSFNYPAQSTLTFNSITDQITMLLKSNSNYNNSITMMVSERSMSTIKVYNNSYYKTSFLLNPSYNSIFIENNSPESQMATIIQTQFIDEPCNQANQSNQNYKISELEFICIIIAISCTTLIIISYFTLYIKNKPFNKKEIKLNNVQSPLNNV